MPQISLEVPHKLGLEEAASRLKHRLSLATEMYQSKVSDLSQQWNGHTLSFGFHAMGIKIAGTLAVEHEKVKVAASIPFAAMFFKKTIEERVCLEVGKALG
jgi:hypothetical protein